MRDRSVSADQGSRILRRVALIALQACRVAKETARVRIRVGRTLSMSAFAMGWYEPLPGHRWTIGGPSIPGAETFDPSVPYWDLHSWDLSPAGFY